MNSELMVDAGRVISAVCIVHGTIFLIIHSLGAWYDFAFLSFTSSHV